MNVLVRQLMLLFPMLLLLAGCSPSANNALQGFVVSPPRPVTHMILLDAEGKAYPIGLLKGQWSYLLFANSECGETCLDQLQQTSVLDGQPGVQMILLAGFEPAAGFGSQLHATQPELKIAVLTRSIWAIFTMQFQDIQQQVGENAFMLINPDGLLVMAYDELVSPDQLLSDLASLRQKK
jgi:cytochrome oxidase Cu insertion factor (SCO1/SenC/PrrC family)